LPRFAALERLRKKILAGETGTIIKTGYCPLEVGIVALSPYAVVMDSLGFQTVYRLFNQHPEVRCERIFFLNRRVGEENGEWLSLESGRKPRDFPVLASSISYEQELLRLPTILQDARIPLYTAERADNSPIVFCGGPVITANPEPAAAFIDVCGIGDSERLVPEFAELWLAALEQGWNRERLLGELAERPGFYIPALYKIKTVEGEYPAVPAPERKEAPRKVQRVAASLDCTPVHSGIVSNATHFKGMFLVEVARGCRWRCRFCLVSQVNRPYRYVEAKRVIEVLDEVPPEARAIGLVGANLCDHPELEMIIEEIARRDLRLGVSSLRVDTVSEGLLELFKACKVKSLTLAPETASQKLLARIGKRYIPGRLFEVVELIAKTGFDSLKLYYMAGLPGEQSQHRQELISQIKELAGLVGPRMRLKISLNTFIPKPQTAWQDESMFHAVQIKQAVRQIRRGLTGLGAKVQLQAGSVAEFLAQAALSLGDRTMAQAVVRTATTGGRFLDCLALEGIELEPVLFKRKKPTIEHPWSVLECEHLQD